VAEDAAKPQGTRELLQLWQLEIYRMHRRHILTVPLLTAVFCLATVIPAGGPALAASTANRDEEAVSQSLKTFTQLYNLVEQNFADPVKSETAFYQGAIPGMLNTLDPHSHFFDPKEFAAMQEDNRETYFGVGMTVRPDNKNTIVVAPFPGSPAFRAGLRPGDIIMNVNGTNTEGKGTTEVTFLLKGPRGTRAVVKIARAGNKDLLTFTIIRDEIPHPSVSEAFWLKPGIAYLKVIQFKENTSREMLDNLNRLGEDNIKGLVLDLRENPGGLLNEGIEVAGHFLKRNQLVVSDRGRVKPAKNYTAHTNNGGRAYPIVVVVNRSSASAAEIVTGALQDHDRAWVLGETTFGKGLVQEVLRLSDNTGMALTTMHYYTPSGRLIQRDYSNISFLQYYYNKDDKRNDADIKHTDSGRTVYGGGGITPDEKFAEPKLNAFQIETEFRKSAFFKFSANYFGPKPDPKLPESWEPDENMVNDFHQYLLDNKVKFTEAEFTENHQWIKNEIKREFFITAFNSDASVRVAIQQDPEIAKAVESMPKALMLVDSSKEVIVQRQPIPGDLVH
jgi:carboxyl-terminal processing protease